MSLNWIQNHQEIPDYVNRYTEIRLAVPGVKRLIEQLPSPDKLHFYTDGNFELECRLGKIPLDGHHHFESGVSKQFFDNLLTEMELYDTVSTSTTNASTINTNRWTAKTQWEESHDFYYEMTPNADELKSSGVLMRTSVTFTEHEGIQTRHVVKHKIDQIQFRNAWTSPNVYHDPENLFDIRFSLNYEQVYGNHQVPQCVQPLHVRIKSRKSYYHQPENHSKPVWRIDFTKVWADKTKTLAEMKQKLEDPVYEIELECLEPFEYMNTTRQNQTYLATSMLLKIRKMFGVQTGQAPFFQFEPFLV